MGALHRSEISFVQLIGLYWIETCCNTSNMSLLVFHIHISPSTSSGQCNRASWASQPQKPVTLQPQPAGRPCSPRWTCGGIGLKKKI
jgi:hypothetical protein